MVSFRVLDFEHEIGFGNGVALNRPSKLHM